MIRVAKGYMTLLELIVVIGVLSLAAGFATISIRRFYLEQKTLDEMEGVCKLLNEASSLMMLVNLDSSVEFRDQKVSLFTKSSRPPSLDMLLNQKPLELRYIDSISFEDPFSNQTLTPPFELVFISKGFIMNRGVLQMKGGGTIRSIILYGYPAPLSLQEGERVFYPLDRDLQDLIERVTEETGQETAS